MVKLKVWESIQALKIGQYILDDFDKEMSKKLYTWAEVKEFINNVSDSMDKELEEYKKEAGK